MKVLHINSYFSTSGLFKELYDRQVESGLDLDVYVPISYEYPEERIAAKGDYVRTDRVFHQYQRYIFHWKHHNILNSLLQTYSFEDYQLIHAHSLFSNGWLAYQLWKKYQIPYVVAVRNSDVRTFFAKMPWLRKMGLNILQNAQHIIFISKNSYNEVYEKYIPQKLVDPLKAKTSIITNGIHQYWLDNRYVKEDFSLHEPLRLITVGKVYAGKRFEQLAEMVQNYSLIRPIELNIVGPDWDKSLTEQLKKTDNVIYHGAKSKEELLAMYRQMDIFALLSSPETFGLVYPEAMSQGLPVIYTENEGFDSFFPNYLIGVSVEKNDSLDFSKALDYIIKHYERISLNASASVDSFNWDSINEQYLKVYKKYAK